MKCLEEHLREALERWGVEIVNSCGGSVGIKTRLNADTIVRVVLVHPSPMGQTLFNVLSVAFLHGADFQIVVEADESARDRLVSKLFAALAPPEWERVLVITPHQIYQAFRFIEDAASSGAVAEILKKDGGSVIGSQTFRCETAGTTDLAPTKPFEPWTS